MKTIKLNNGTIIRLSDAEAHETVRRGYGEYCPKWRWKERLVIIEQQGERQ
jgi:hypothetical protein